MHGIDKIARRWINHIKRRDVFSKPYNAPIRPVSYKMRRLRRKFTKGGLYLMKHFRWK